MTPERSLPVFGAAPTRKEAPRKQQETRQRTRQTPDQHSLDDPRPRREDKQTHTGTRASTPGRKNAPFLQNVLPWTDLGSGPSFFDPLYLGQVDTQPLSLGLGSDTTQVSILGPGTEAIGLFSGASSTLRMKRSIQTAPSRSNRRSTKYQD